MPKFNVTVINKNNKKVAWEEIYKDLDDAKKKAGYQAKEIVSIKEVGDSELTIDENTDTSSEATSSGGIIAGLATFYKGFTVILFWLFVISFVIGVVWFLAEATDYINAYPWSSYVVFLPAGILISVSLLGIIAVGATAVLLDIMNNIRELNKKTQNQIVTSSGNEKE